VHETDEPQDLTRQVIEAAAEGADQVLVTLHIDQPTDAEQVLAEALATVAGHEPDGNDFIRQMYNQAQRDNTDRLRRNIPGAAATK
jgi:hypothetical protein